VEYLTEALKAHQSGRLTEALPLYERALAQRSADPDVLHFFGLLRHNLGQSGEAIGMIKRSLLLAPENSHAWLNLGNILSELGQHDKARTAYLEAGSLAPESADVWYSLGMCLRKLNEAQAAVESLSRALELRPEHAPSLYQRALARRELREYAGAATDFQAALVLEPKNPCLHESLGQMLYRLGRIEDAARVYRSWREIEPGSVIANYLAGSMSGDKDLVRAPDQYITESFNRFADTYEDNLTSLGYKAHELASSALRAAAAGTVPLSRVLDAGCGTGFCGVLLRPIALHLTGVDLSASMMGVARAKGCYDELHPGELTAFMRAHAQSFDAIVAADTLNYFGALEAPFASSAGCLKRGGWLVITLEKMLGDASESYRIEPHGRYSHRLAYVRSALEQTGFDLVAATEHSLRRERGEEVAGLIVTARRHVPAIVEGAQPKEI
jgi:predicted TPR repeat methyltransferase